MPQYQNQQLNEWYEQDQVKSVCQVIMFSYLYYIPFVYQIQYFYHY